MTQIFNSLIFVIISCLYQHACVYLKVENFEVIGAYDIMDLAGDHLRQAVLGCFNSIFTSSGVGDERSKAEQELKALEATDGKVYSCGAR